MTQKEREIIAYYLKIALKRLAEKELNKQKPA